MNASNNALSNMQRIHDTASYYEETKENGINDHECIPPPFIAHQQTPNQDNKGPSTTTSVADKYELTTMDIQPAAFADTATAQINRQSLFFSQEASSIFDKAFEMHAAPTDDPPMWGDNFEDLREVADMLEDIDDFPMGNEAAVGQRDYYDPPNFKTATSNRESFGCFLDDATTSSVHALDAKLNGDESKSCCDYNVTRTVNGSNSAALNDETDMPLHIMNMDKRIFEDNMFIGDIADDEDDSFSDAFSYNRGIFDNSALDNMSNSKLGPPDSAAYAASSREVEAPHRELPLREEPNLALPANHGKSIVDNTGPNALNSKLGQHDTTAHVRNLREFKAPCRELPLRKEADIALPSSKYDQSIVDNVSPDMLHSKLVHRDAGNLRELKAPYRELATRKEPNLALPSSEQNKGIFDKSAPNNVSNTKLGPPGIAVYATDSRELIAPYRELSFRKVADLPLQSYEQNRGIFGNTATDMLRSKFGPPDNAAYVGSLQELKAPRRGIPLRKEADLSSQASNPDLRQPITPLQTVTPGLPDEARIVDLKQGTHIMMPVVAHLSQGKASPENSTNSMQSIHSCNDRTEPVVAKKQKTKNHHPRGTGKSDAAWKRRYLELREFKRQHGHCNVQQKYDNNPSLGAWIARQRLIMRHWDDQCENKTHVKVANGKSFSIPERIQQLKNIGLESSIGKGAFGKLCTRNTNEWEKQFSDLLQYRDAHGNCNVPTKNTTLGRWVSSQRKKYRQFSADEGTYEDHVFGWSKELRSRFQRLNEIGFNFHVGKGKAQQNKSNLTETMVKH